ncbi:MAG: outer membrane lipoprotein-sorting protein [Gammaproteobacteria bacterium]|nr:outer membrane lipoprotein-sorting protein [Gammaproteobacteria bacterium]
MIAGIAGALNIEVDDRRIDSFNKNEPVYQADKLINAHFDGTSVFDIVVETDEPEALFKPHFLQKIEAFQSFIGTHKIVGGTTSVVDYLKQMNRSLNEGNAAYYRLVDDSQLNAQLFLLYSTSGDPTDFEEEIDYDYQRANIRVNLKSPSYQEIKPVIAALNEYIELTFNEPGLRATISGRAMVTYEWTDSVGQSHFNSVLVSLLLVFAMAAFVFRSATAGLLSLAPVAISILFVYAVMATVGIDIGIGTSMFASVAIGLGVDFAIHTIDRIRSLYAQSSGDSSVMLALFPSTGRALFFNLLALACGFGVLMSSEVVPLMRFGAIVALSVSTAFLFSLTFLPALILLLKPRFVYGNKPTTSVSVANVMVVGVALSVLAVGSNVQASEIPIDILTGRAAMEKVVARDDGKFVTRTLTMELTDRRGKSRVRETRSYRKYFGEEKRTVLFYVSPANIKDTGFLTWDYPGEEIDDDQWLYLPAVRKIRRISATDRGDYFLGTDFSYEDVKNEAKPNLSDYEHQRLGVATVDGANCIIVEGLPVSKKIAQELGYSKVVSYIDTNIWISRKTEFWDTQGNPLKVIEARDIRLINGIWTTHELVARNHKTGHKTRFTFSDIDYLTPIDDNWFETRRLRRGL